MDGPDRCVVRGKTREYRGRHPGPDDIVLPVDVADSSLSDDRTLGNLVYGPAGVPIYWIVNLVDRQIEVYTGPGPTAYSGRRDHRSGEAVPVTMDGQELGVIAVDDVMA